MAKTRRVEMKDFHIKKNISREVESFWKKIKFALGKAAIISLFFLFPECCIHLSTKMIDRHGNY